MIIGLAQVKPDKVDGSTEGSFAATHVNLHILLMSHLTPTINCSKIRMVKYLLDMLALTAGTVPL